MFYFLSKTIFVIAMPITWLVLLLFYAWFAKHSRKKNRIIASALLLLFLMANPAIVNRIMLWWEVPPVTFASMQETYEVGIILSGTVNLYKAPKDRVHIYKGSDRILHAATLYHQGIVKKLIITGGYPKGHLGDEATDMARVLRMCQVPDSAIIIEPKAQNTRENATYTAALLAEYFPKVKQPLLITSAFHMRRSLACFKKAGIEAQPFSVDFYTYDSESPPLKVYFWPNEHSFWKFSVWVHEVVGLVVYKLMGYV